VNGKKVFYTLPVFVPVTFWLGLAHASPTAIFVVSCLAILPLAGLMGEATEQQLVQDGRTNWFEGAQLLAVYAILAVAFYFI
jgi:Ca2+/H+ antiporter